ncbi:MAG: hypothetical protein HC892_04645 [Saprospiraceae bacterium]|nr:hypothetical protein [Saprospiraceae bacterium]
MKKKSLLTIHLFFLAITFLLAGWEAAYASNGPATSHNNADAPPKVTFINPRNGDIFTEGTDLTVEVDASDQDGRITKIDLFLNDELVGTDIAVPYVWDASAFTELQNLTPGTYSLKAVATNNTSETGMSTISFTVTDNALPVVTFINPTNNASFKEGKDLTVEVIASDADGFVASVALTLNNQPIATLTSLPFIWNAANYPLLQDLTPGTYTLKAVAIDDFGEQGTTTITVNILDNVPPTVTFTTPLNGDRFKEKKNLDVVVAASDSDGSVANVELFFNNTSLGKDSAAPFRWNAVDNPALQNLIPGIYTLKAVATDDTNEKRETIITITIFDNALPTVSFIVPLNGASVIEQSDINVQVNAADTDGNIARAELFLNNQTVGTLTAAPFTWNAAQYPALQSLDPGNYTLRVTVTDDFGESASANVSIVVRDNIFPKISFVTPVDGSEFIETTDINVEVAASDDDGTIANVELFLDNRTVGVLTSAPFVWNANIYSLLQNFIPGIYQFKAVATDNFGESTSATISVEILDNILPVISFTTPTAGQTFMEGVNLNVQATATDADGTIASVQLFLNEQLVGTDVSVPYAWGTSFSLLRNLQPGTYVLKATARDDFGETASTSITITVTDNTAAVL